MCGILGLFKFRQSITDSDLEKFRSANLKMTHRGPDYAEVHQVNDRILLGHNRLSIIDLAEVSNQPFRKSNSADALVFNGELYNFKELRTQLETEGLAFSTKGDTEVLYEGFKKRGHSFLDEMNGMFAFAYWDSIENKLSLVRDRLGIKPMYILKSDDYLVFSSEIRPLLAYSKKAWSSKTLQEWLFYQTNPSNQTYFDDLKLLSPGSWLTCSSSGDIQSGTYYDLKSSFHKSEDFSTEKLRNLITVSVKDRLISDVPLGAFLSGGIDSSVVVAAMRSIHSGSISTFSVGFDDPNYDERIFAKEVSNKFETDHHELLYSSSEILDLIPKAVDSLDYPTGDAINTWLVSKATKDAGIIVALSGLGGDELFGGYPSFSRFSNPKFSKPAFLKTANYLAKIFGKRSREFQKIKTLFELKPAAFSHVAVSRAVFLPDQIAELAKSDSFHPYKSGIDEVMYQELSQYTIPLLLRDADQASMAHALELRVPLLDYRLVNYMAAVNPTYRYLPNRPYPKSTLVEAFKDDLPEMVYKRKKQGFVLPLDNWLRNELKQFAKESLFDSPLTTLLDGSAIQELWADFLHQKSYVKWSMIWSLVILGRWMQTNQLNGK